MREAIRVSVHPFVLPDFNLGLVVVAAKVFLYHGVVRIITERQAPVSQGAVYHFVGSHLEVSRYRT